MGIDYRHPRRHSPAPSSPQEPPPTSRPDWALIDNIRDEWPKDSLDSARDLRNYRQALALYGRGDYPSMMQCAMWFATALAHSLYGEGILRGDDLPNTVHKTLYCALSAPPDGKTFAETAQRSARLALTIMRENGWQPPAYGGTNPVFGPMMTDTGNRMLLSAAIAPPAEPWNGDLRAFFSVPPALRTGPVADPAVGPTAEVTGRMLESPDPAGPSVRPRRTLSGRPVTEQEELGAQPRRGRLMAAAVRLLDGHPLGAQSAHGVALGDGYGMEGLVDQILPLFRREMSLARWAAIRGALLFLDMLCPDDRQWRELMPIMGIAPVADPKTGGPGAMVLHQGGAVVGPDVEQNILGLFWAITERWGRYAQVSAMSVEQVNADPFWARVGAPMALDFIAWTAVAFLRTGQMTSELISSMPEPGMLEEPGWYADPLFAKCERYWSGDDWTDRVRVKNRRTWEEVRQPLR